MIGTYTKCIIAAVMAGVTAAITALNDNGNITLLEWVVVASAVVVTGGAVFAVPNVPASVRRYGKAIVAAVLAGLGSVAVALTDGGVSNAEWLTIALAVIGGLGPTYIAPNAALSDEFRGVNNVVVPPH